LARSKWSILLRIVRLPLHNLSEAETERMETMETAVMAMIETVAEVTA
jgi:hypothetical protein